MEQRSLFPAGAGVGCRPPRDSSGLAQLPPMIENRIEDGLDLLWHSQPPMAALMRYLWEEAAKWTLCTSR